MARIGMIKVHNLTTPSGRAVLPDEWTAIRWPMTGWVDCRSFVESSRFAWEMRTGAYADFEVEVLAGEASCTDPQWCDQETA